MAQVLHIMNYTPRTTRTMDHFVLALTRAFARKGWAVRYAFADEPAPEFREALADAGGSYVVIPFPFTRASAAVLRQKMGHYRPDVVQTSFLSAFNGALLSLKRRGFTRRLVVIDHTSSQTPVRRGWKRLAGRLRGWWVGRTVDAVVPVSQAIARRDIERVFLPARKVRVVYNGIRLDLFQNRPREAKPVVRVVYAGLLASYKGVMTLLRAHDRLRKSGVTNYELLIAGTGGQEAELKAFCTANGHEDVRFLGHVDSVPELFGSADVVVVPSEWYEAFGLVAAEAMASGAACLVSDAGALPEVVGTAGRVFKAGDDADLAQRLGELVADPETCRRLGSAGRERVEKMFTLEQMVEGHAAACEDVLRAHS